MSSSRRSSLERASLMTFLVSERATSSPRYRSASSWGRVRRANGRREGAAEAEAAAPDAWRGRGGARGVGGEC